MGLFLSFLGGAAKEFSEQIETSEKDAKVFAVNNVKAMAERANKVREENTKLSSKLKEERDFLLSYYPNATPEQITEILARPAVMDAIKKYKDPTKINLDSLVKVSQANESDALAAEKVAALPDIVERARSLAAPSMVMRRNPLGRVIDEFGASAYRSATQQTAAALGTTMEEIAGTTPLQRPTPRGQVDMSVFVQKPEFKDIKDKAKTDMLDAVESGDANRIKTASAKVARIAFIEEQGTTKNKTESQIQSDLITQIQEAEDPKEKQRLTNQLRQRQALEKSPVTQGKTDADKISQANLITTATKMRDSVLADMLPPGSFVTVIDPNTGASTINVKELKQPELYKQGVEAGRSAIIKEFTNPQTGMPRSEMHKNAMMAVGIQFDQTGRPVGGETPAPASAPAAGMAAPKTKAEYDAIPSGTQYRDTDGKVKIKR